MKIHIQNNIITMFVIIGNKKIQYFSHKKILMSVMKFVSKSDVRLQGIIYSFQLFPLALHLLLLDIVFISVE